jgi:hypothetical protein
VVGVAITTSTRPRHIADDWKAISLEVQGFSTPEVKVTTKRKTVVAKKWIFLD